MATPGHPAATLASLKNIHEATRPVDEPPVRLDKHPLQFEGVRLVNAGVRADFGL